MIFVINKYKVKVSKELCVYIGRGSSPLGNPYTHKPIDTTRAEFEVATREEAIAKYREWLLVKISERDRLVCDELNRIYQLAKVGDVYLICTCKPLDCHGDVIKEIIEAKLWIIQ